MRLYFSGVASASESAMLKDAGVTDWLADPTDFGNLPNGSEHVRVLDSGAYRAFKQGAMLDVDAYVARVTLEEEGQIARAIAPDVIGDSIATRKNWRRVEDLFRAFECEGMRTDNPESSTTSHKVDLNLISRQLKLISVLLSAIVLFLYLILMELA